MHHQTTRALYEFFPLNDKNDFFAAYLYPRYPEHFIYHVSCQSGIRPFCSGACGEGGIMSEISTNEL